MKNNGLILNLKKLVFCRIWVDNSASEEYEYFNGYTPTRFEKFVGVKPKKAGFIKKLTFSYEYVEKEEILKTCFIDENNNITVKPYVKMAFIGNIVHREYFDTVVEAEAFFNKIRHELESPLLCK